MSEISQSKLKEILDYDRETGIFRNRISRGSRAKKGCAAGWVDRHGYRKIVHKGKIYCAHRLAWLYEFGIIPDRPIDHINHIRDDNRISNIRLVSPQGNSRNKSMASNNISGKTGVFYHKRDCRWLAKISINGQQVELGRYKCKENAVSVRVAAEKKHGYHENHGT
jgi:hypothetical protein